jgi:hypothetical protein
LTAAEALKKDGAVVDILYQYGLQSQGNTFYDRNDKRFLHLPRLSKHHNKWWREQLAERYTLQIDEEGICNWEFVSTLGWSLYGKRLISEVGGRFRGFEQERGVTVVVSELGRYTLPREFRSRTRLVGCWLSKMPPNTRVKGPRDFGGKFMGSLRPGTGEKGRYVKLESEMWYVKRVLSGDSVEWVEFDDGEVYIQGMSYEDAEAYVRDRFLV